jgi:hypothetical protein
VLQNNAGNNLPVAKNGSFTFTKPVPSGGKYNVTVFAQPSSPAQACTVTNGSGKATANVTNVQVTCGNAVTFTIAGTVAGLTGTGLVLQDNAGNNLPVTANGSFTFTTGIASGSAYNVTVLTQPSSPAQTCTVTNGSGKATANVTNVQVNCGNAVSYTIAVTVAGLTGTGLVLQNNASNNLPVTANGSFTFTTGIASGSAYNVTVLTQPSNPAQTCTVTNGSGKATANVTNVQVNCGNAVSYTIAVTVAGLTGTGLVLQNNASNNLPVTANGSFTFTTGIASGSAYNVTVLTQPSNPAQTCTVTNGSGKATANVTNVQVNCGNASEAPKIVSVAFFPQAPSTTSAATSSQVYMLEINGTGFESITDMSKVSIAVFPAAGVTPSPIPALSRSLDNSKILAQFNASANYALEEIALFTGSSLLPYSTGASSCDFASKVTLTPQIVPKGQSGNKYGNGVAKNFYAVQISIVNECPMAIVVPLAGITVAVNSPAPSSDPDACREDTARVAFSLDHVTSIYSADRKLTGRRAIYFNSVQALATLGSAIEPFFGPSFTTAVAILGGGFTTASKEIFVDMSAEQLQNLTSQSFGSTEQVAPHGSLQKFVFVRRSEKCKKFTIEKELTRGDFSVKWQLSPASTEAPTTQTAAATVSASAVQPR